MMEHYWMDLQGESWFDYDGFYAAIIRMFPSGAKFVEVGAHRGKSAAFMGVEIINSEKNIHLTCIDYWTDDNVYKDFIQSTEQVGSVVSYHKMLSWEGAKLFEDESIDFCFIDAGHDYFSIKKDILAWLPKVKIGGIIAGHDYNPEEGKDYNYVSAVINKVIGKSNLDFLKNVWIYEKNKTMTLEELAVQEGTDKQKNCHNYTEFYSMFFEPIRNEKLSLLEIGVDSGFSMRMWHKYFPNAEISGIDLRGNYEYLIEEGCKATYIVDQSDKGQLEKFAQEHHHEYDIIVEDGSHNCEDQILTFEVLFPALKPNGFYVTEDVLCAADPTRWAKNANSVDYFKKLIMDVNMGLKIDPGHLCSNKLIEARKYDNLTYAERHIKWAFMSTGLIMIKKMNYLNNITENLAIKI